MSRPVVDGQRRPKPEPMPEIVLRPVVVEPIAAAETIEVSLSMWLEESEWETTLRMDLTDLAG